MANIKVISASQVSVPYMRAAGVQFNAKSLRPNKSAYFYFDDRSIDNYIQNSSVITCANGSNASVFSDYDLVMDTSTHAVASVITTSGAANAVYLNENYVSLVVAPYGANVPFTSTTFSTDQTIFQGSNNNPQSASFSAAVVFWDSANNVLTVNPTVGTVNSSMFFMKADNTSLLGNVSSIIAGNKFPAGSSLFTIANPSANINVAAYVHNSGMIQIAPANNNTLTLSGTFSNPIGKTFYISKGSGEGLFANIIANTANTITLDAGLSTIPAGNSRYSIGRPVVDQHGTIAGVFNIPSASTGFLVGNRVFSITDSATYGDSNVSMTATATFSTGKTPGYIKDTIKLGNSSTPTVPVIDPQVQLANSATTQAASPSIRTVNQDDPNAQTFFTPPPTSTKENYGIFVSSIDLWFSAIPSASSPQLPVTVKLVEVENGFPTTKILGISTISPSSVNVANASSITGDPSNSNPTKTKFVFADPVYLKPSFEYGIVITSDSPEYAVWISEIGASDITDKTNTRRVSDQPNSGSFFRAQNASQWTPSSNQDLMFVVNKAQYSTSPTTIRFAASGKQVPTMIDSLILSSDDVSFPNTSISYNVYATYAGTNTLDSGINVIPNKILNYGKDLRTSSKGSNRRRYIPASNTNSFFVDVTMQTNDPDISPIVNSERLAVVGIQNMVNPAWISPADISITSGGAHSNTANITVTISAPAVSTGTQAVANVLPSQLVSGKITGLNIITPGSGYTKVPTITITEPGASSNATVAVAGETNSSGGNGYARYMTKKITLADGFDAGDLRVFINAIKPQGTTIAVYYKIMSGSDPAPFANKKWILMNVIKDQISVDQSTPVEMQYVPNIGLNGLSSGEISYVENGVTYPLGGTFKYFAIKIVLSSDDPTVPPVVKALRAIALPKG